MKHLFFVYLIFTALLLTAAAQKEKNNVPAAAKTAFEKAFPGAKKVKWGNEKTGYEAEFILKGKQLSAVYDNNGVLKQTEEAIKIAALPALVKDYIKQHYPNKSIKEAAKITKSNAEINYQAEVNKMDLIFDA